MGLGRPRLAVSLPPTTGRHSRAFTGACHASFERVRPHPSPAAPLAFARPLGMRVPPAIASLGSCRVHRKLGRQEPDAQPPMSAGCCVSSCREGGRPGPPLHTDAGLRRILSWCNLGLGSDFHHPASLGGPFRRRGSFCHDGRRSLSPAHPTMRRLGQKSASEPRF